MRKNTRLSAAVSALCLCNSHAALAQAVGDPGINLSDASSGQRPAKAQMPEVQVIGRRPDDYDAQTATVGAKTPSAMRDIPQSVTVIDRALLDAQNAVTLVDALRNVPGITLSAGEGGQIGNNINLRGFSARTDIYLDGMRDRGQYQRDLFSLEAVEVLEGSSSLLFGRGSTGGIINQVSKQPRLKPIDEMDVSVGEGDLYRATADLDHALGSNSAFRVAAMTQSIHPTRDVARIKDWGVAPSLALGIGTPTEVNFSLLTQHNNDIPDYGFPLLRFQGQSAAEPIDAPSDRYYGYTNDRYNQDVEVAHAAIRHQFDSGITLRNETQYSDYRTDAAVTPLGGLLHYDAASNTYSSLDSTTVPAGTPLDQLVIAVQQRDRSIRDTSLYNQTDVLFELHGGPFVHHFTAGSEIGRDEYVNNYYGWYNFNYNNGAGLSSSANATTGNVAVFNLGGFPYGPKPSGANVYRVPSNVTDTIAHTLAAYLNDEIAIGAQWKLVAGLRWDRFAADQTYLNYAYNGLITSNTNPAKAAAVAASNAAALRTPALSNYETSHTDRAVSTRAGLIWQPDAKQSYYVSYGTSFDPLAEAVAGLPTSGATAGQYADAMTPEKNRTYEAGAKWTPLGSRFELDSAVFQVEKTNARTLDPVTSLYTLDGDVRVRGAELKWAGRLLPGWQVFGGYTYLDGKIVQSVVAGNQGSVPQQTPRHTASLWNTYSLRGGLEIGSGVTCSSYVWTNNTQTAKVPGYARLDASVGYRFRSGAVRLNLQNLTDKTYFLTSSGARATPADGFRAVLTASYDFR